MSQREEVMRRLRERRLIAVVRSTAAGTRYVLPIPSANERYLRGTFTLGGTTPSVTYSAWVTSQEPSAWAAYPDAL